MKWGIAPTSKYRADLDVLGEREIRTQTFRINVIKIRKVIDNLLRYKVFIGQRCELKQIKNAVSHGLADIIEKK